MNQRPTSLRARAAQLVFARLGSNMPPPVRVEEDAARVEALLGRCPLGGLILFNGRFPEATRVLARLQGQSRYPLLVGADMERGAGQQIEGATVFPHAMAYGATGTAAEALVEQTARATAREALACGVHLTFMPVADLNLHPRNPIISTRAYGSDPREVARLVRAYVRGARAEGLLTTAKHFPGHGRTAADSHAELPVVEASREELDGADLVPFRAAVEAGADAVMTAHVVYPALDASGLPATLSRPILHDLLRTELGFEGLVVTDSLLMGAVRDAQDAPGAQAAALLRAGVDVLLDPPEPEALVDGLVRAVEAGRLPEARLNEACGRVWALKKRLGTRAFAPDAGAAAHAPGSAAHRKLAQEVATRAVTVLKTRPGALPIPPLAGEALLVVRVVPRRTRLEGEDAPLARAVRTVFPGARYREVGPEAGEGLLAQIRREAAEARHVVLALVAVPAAWHAFGLLPVQRAFVAALAAERPVVAAALGHPHVLEDVPQAAARLCTYSDTAPSQEALVRVLAAQAQDTSRG